MLLSPEKKLILNNGNEIPPIGLGTYNAKGREVQHAVEYAIQAGYRLIDTATFYENEKEIGRAIQKNGIKRSELFITSKIWKTDQGTEKPLKAIDTTLDLLQTDYLDLYLIHWPYAETRLQTWTAFEKILASGKAKSIGVSNYTIQHLEELQSVSGIVPVVNQVEFHPFQFERELLEYCNAKNIIVEAHTPLIRCRKNNIPLLQTLQNKYQKSPAQVLLRWCLQHGTLPLPKSSNKERIKENLDVFDFNIKQEDMRLLDTINEEYRVVLWDPRDEEWK
ncbi:MAG: aldo/keto reductase [bacterium]|nr:aldo/keto reductase [bacterium]